MATRKELNRVEEKELVVLLKQYVVVWYIDDEDVTWLQVALDNNGSVCPGAGSFYAEFDNKADYDQYLADNNLTDLVNPW